MEILNIIITSFFFLWLLAFFKKAFFWIYLWQLKEYHLGRFKAHFSTFKGKKSIFNILNYLKFFLILFFIITLGLNRESEFFLFFFPVIFLIYSAEGLKFIKDLSRRKAKFPILTLKTLLISILAIIVLFSFFILSINWISGLYFYYLLLIFDFLIPLTIFLLVFIVHSFIVLWRLNLIKKAKRKRKKFPNLLTIGITGSFGKSSVKEFLAAILENRFKVLKTKDNQNSEVGISRTILTNLKPEHQIFIAEMGAYNRGGIKLLCDIVQPKIGILTGINEQHLATFGSQENIIKAKYELIESLPENGLAVFNGDNSFCREFYEKTNRIAKKIVFSKNISGFPADMWAENIILEKERLEFDIRGEEGRINIKTSLLGKHNILNILMAAAVAKNLGMSLEEIKKGIERVKRKKSPMKLIKIKSGVNIIDSSYSANPDGVIADLEYLKLWGSSEGHAYWARKIIIMPCLIELGSSAKNIHKKIGRKIAEVCDMAIIITRDYFREIKEGAIEKGMSAENILFIEDPKEIIERIKKFNGQNNIILLEGRMPKEIIRQLTIENH